MAADLTKLTPQFQEKVQQLLQNCLDRKIEMRPYEALRDPFSQARIWRQSRSIEEINKKIQELKFKGAPFIANCIETVGPQNGKHVTNAIPGLSWHQWGEAIDCFWLVEDKAVFSLTDLVNGINGFQVYASEARKIHLEAGLFWTNFQDSPHVQLRRESSPISIYNLQEIDAKMQRLFNL